MTTTGARPGRLPGPGALGVVVVLGGLGALGWWLRRLGAGSLATPALDRPGDWVGWADRVGAATAAFAVLRLVCLVATAYVAVCVLIGLVASRSRHARVRRFAQLICLPPVRRLLEGMLGVGIGVGALGAVAGPVAVAGAVPAGPGWAGAAAPTRSAVPAMVERTAITGPAMRAVVSGEVPPAAAPLMTLRAASPSTAPTMTLRATGTDGADGAAPSSAPVDPAQESPPPTPALPAGEPAEGALGTGQAADYVVEAGDHFWRIAERTIAAALGREPVEAEVGAYWRRLVDANVDRLSDPTNPDLLFPGQAVVLPAP